MAISNFAGFTVALVLLMAGIAAAQEIPEIMAYPDAVSILVGDRQLLRYRYGDVAYKPYVDEFLTPGGINVLRDAPEDHKHHHGLMFAVKVDGVNFWEEHVAPGREQHRAFSSLEVDKRGDRYVATFTEHIDWVNPGSQEVLLKERRTIQVPQVKDLGVSLLVWQSRFELPPGKKSATLTGAHYHGLGVRFLESMDTGGRFRNADDKRGETVRGDERLAPSTWCAFGAQADGKPVTVAMFGHPDNPRHPATWFTMAKPFAYMSATMKLHEEPLKILSGQPLVLRYGVALWDGPADNDQIEQIYQKWANGYGSVADKQR